MKCSAVDMSTEILHMSSPGSQRAYETTANRVPPSPTVRYSIPEDPSTPQLPYKNTAYVQQSGLESSSRASTPLSSVMDVDNLSTEPSSPPSANASAAKPEASKPHTVPKKPKLTFAEKETLRIEKQFKEQQKAEDKARKEAQREAEKLEREEKKRLAAEEKEAKKRQQEAEKEQKRKEQDELKEEKRKAKEEKDAIKLAENASKEAEKKAKEEEKAKKERSQLKLNAFFVKKAQSVGSAASSRRNSVSSLAEASPKKSELPVVIECSAKEASDYEKLFQPFFLHPYTTIAPQSRFEDDRERAESICIKLDEVLSHPQPVEKIPSLKRSFQEASHEPYAKRRRLGNRTVAIRDLIAKVNVSESGSVDPTGSGTLDSQKALAALRNVPMKYLRYAEDVRPPYIGTYTKLPKGHSVKKLCLNPFIRALPAVNYDYDSEAEWEEPEEGDNCDTDEEDSDADEDDDDMAGFLDDEEDAPKRRNVMGDMEPVSTNLFWQERQHRHGAIQVSFGSTTLDLDAFRISPLRVEAIGSIDPFSTCYWNPAPPAASTASDATLMAPPSRVPLNPLLAANSRLTVDPSTGLHLKPPPGSLTASGAAASAQQPPKGRPAAKPFPAELLDEFKRAIDGSDLSKVGLVEVLKKKFPQVTGKTIQDAVPLVAKRDGKNHAEKKWVLI